MLCSLHCVSAIPHLKRKQPRTPSYPFSCKHHMWHDAGKLVRRGHSRSCTPAMGSRSCREAPLEGRQDRSRSAPMSVKVRVLTVPSTMLHCTWQRPCCMSARALLAERCLTAGLSRARAPRSPASTLASRLARDSWALPCTVWRSAVTLWP